MTKINKLTKLIKALTPDQTLADFTEFDKQVSVLKENLKEKITVKTLDDVSVQLERFKKKLNLQALISSMDNLKVSFDSRSQELFDEIERKTNELSTVNKDRVESVRFEIAELKIQLSSLEEARKKDIERIKSTIPDLVGFESIVNEMMLEVFSRLDLIEDVEKEEVNWQEKIDKIRMEFMNRLSQLEGGSMNRQETFNNIDRLTRYTDINWKAGTNVSFTIANNDTTKRTDVTVSATGGGGGTTRVINSVSVSTAADSAAGTDHVYLCSGTMTLTMPDATSGNTNLYTIKNVGTGVVTINTTSSQTIDNDLTVIMPVRYTSVDLISDTANWNVT